MKETNGTLCVSLKNRDRPIEQAARDKIAKHRNLYNLLPGGHTPDDISVFDVWHISTVDMYFDISARILAYQWTFGISARILTYQPGFWHITRAPFRHLAYQKQQWEALRFDFVKHTGKRCLVPRR
jgi:hypothetical protein